ncbi:NAD(P)-binding domain-containing protein [Paenibacillus koleovorans]|uniref:mannitol dehydrogenase family protein n=1 Tax=Paenibacillus koleovorans TaxID=121608 RepID=UPI000FD7D79B|nr:NAD(P)-binding domain-containing protein [Paenibacillus koleovorans]
MKIVIIGAGKTGRGFLTRFALRAGASVSFIDKSESLVRKLNVEEGYSIHYFGEDCPPVRVQKVRAAMAGTVEAFLMLLEADLIFTAVGEQHLPQVAESLIRSMKQREVERKPVFVITGENGVRPGQKLEEALSRLGAGAGYPTVVESAIFCSTVERPGTSMDIDSESYEELPYDSVRLPSSRALPSMVAEPKFPELLQRKIYTYNCISACVAYLGAWKGYRLYAEAANDPEIDQLVRQVLGPLNRALAEHLDISLDTQVAFSERAVRKFQDVLIQDDIARNARDVARKLGPAERLIAPASIIRERGGTAEELHPFAVVVAAALHYKEAGGPAWMKRLAEVGPAAFLQEVSGLDEVDPFLQDAVRTYELMRHRGRETSSVGVYL